MKTPNVLLQCLCLVFSAFLLHWCVDFATISSVGISNAAASCFTSNTSDVASASRASCSDSHVFWKLHAEPCEKQGFSQGNQDCVLDVVFEAIGTTNKFYIEYGFNTGGQCQGTGPNTCKLWKLQNWSGLLLDADRENNEINLHAHYLYSDNIVSILDKYDVPLEPDFLSSDMDSHDYFVLESILKSGRYRPRVISTEYNMNFPSLNWTVAEMDPTLSKHDELLKFRFMECTWGVAPGAYKFLLERYGYRLVAVVDGLDLFWTRTDLLQGCQVPSFEQLMKGKYRKTTHKSWSTIDGLVKLVDVNVFAETSSVSEAHVAAVKTVLSHLTDPDEIVPCFKDLQAKDVEQYLQKLTAM